MSDFSATEGVDGNANALPDPPTPDWSAPDADSAPQDNGHHEPPPWLGPIHERMDQLSAQTQAMAEAMQQAAAADDDEYDDGYGDDGYVELTAEEAARLDALSPDELAALGLAPETYAALDGELGDELDSLDGIYGEQDGEPPDVFDLIDRSVSSRLADAEARRASETAIEDREAAFDDLREQLPLLQDEPTARRVVARAQELAQSWDPNLVNTPSFVGLIELVALASIAERATAEQHAQAATQQRIQIESAAGGGSLGGDDGPTETDWGARVVAAAQRLRPNI